MQKIRPFFKDLFADPIHFAVTMTIVAMVVIGVSQMTVH